MTDALEPTRAHCAEHPEVPASGTCPRCGRFVCPACVAAPFPGARVVCLACGPHELAPLEWDSSLSPGSFFQSAWRLTVRPFSTAASLSWDGRIERSILFLGLAELCAAPMYALFMWLTLRMQPQTQQTLAVTLVAGVVGNLVFAIAAEPVFFLGEQLVARLLGGTATWAQAFRAHALGCAGYLPFLVPGLGFPLGIVTSIVSRSACLASAHRLPPWRGFVITLVPLAVLCCGAMGLTLALGFALGSMLRPH